MAGAESISLQLPMRAREMSPMTAGDVRRALLLKSAGTLVAGCRRVAVSGGAALQPGALGSTSLCEPPAGRTGAAGAGPARSSAGAGGFSAGCRLSRRCFLGRRLDAGRPRGDEAGFPGGRAGAHRLLPRVAAASEEAAALARVFFFGTGKPRRLRLTRAQRTSGARQTPRADPCSRRRLTPSSAGPGGPAHRGGGAARDGRRIALRYS
ncbi:hypothetical protein KIL84_007465 [Mauremys mutica]|uniref:Uncharacterized protein n=1 Tax=Mauremys mutica TaxID=74926 RepID=A0A9D3X1D1_9SAUR|nr:hypothetical protein KIL84_007465 [Mauremys mutica]